MSAHSGPRVTVEPARPGIRCYCGLDSPHDVTRFLRWYVGPTMGGAVVCDRELDKAIDEAWAQQREASHV